MCGTVSDREVSACFKMRSQDRIFFVVQQMKNPAVRKGQTGEMLQGQACR
jgi:hypothetical protein